MKRSARLASLAAVVALGGGYAVANGAGAGANSACGVGSALSPDGTVIYRGDCWLGGLGVDVHANGGNSNGYWQCVELPRRLFINRGWAPAGWAPGNGNQVWMASGGGRVSQAQGSITYLRPGDAVSMNTRNERGEPQPYGHVAVVNKVRPIGGGRYAVQLIQQNTLGANVFDGPVWDGRSIQVPDLGWSYDVVGVLHHPGTLRGAITGDDAATAAGSVPASDQMSTSLGQAASASVGGPSVVQSSVDGRPARIDLFTRSPKGELVHTWATRGTNWVRTPQVLTTGIVGQPVAVFRPATGAHTRGTVDVFARNAKGELLHRVVDDNAWAAAGVKNAPGWEVVATEVDDDPSVITRPAENGTGVVVDVFARTKAGALLHLAVQGRGAWGSRVATQIIGRGIIGSPAAVFRPGANRAATDSVQVFAVNERHELVERSFDGTAWPAHDPQRLPWQRVAAGVEPGLSLVSRPTLGNDRPAIDVFARSTRDQLVHFALVGGEWPRDVPAEVVADRIAGAPQAVFRSSADATFASLDVFAGNAQDQLVHSSYDGHAWSTPPAAPEVLDDVVGDPVAVDTRPALDTSSAPALDVFTVGAQGELAQRSTLSATRSLSATGTRRIVQPAP